MSNQYLGRSKTTNSKKAICAILKNILPARAVRRVIRDTYRLVLCTQTGSKKKGRVIHSTRRKNDFMMMLFKDGWMKNHGRSTKSIPKF
jgi:hypothetical protein